MEQSLQYLFVESKGMPVQIGEWTVLQCDYIPIRNGRITLRFLSGATGTQGVALRAKKGSITMSDGRKVQSLKIWHEASLPPSVEHQVECPTAELMIWNVYRIKHPDRSMTEDQWTGNAGMIKIAERQNYRKYGCSDSAGPFSPFDLEFEIEWFEKQN